MKLRIEPLPGTLGPELLAAGRDEAGNPVELILAGAGGDPLRCCLRDSRPGERMVLAAVTPPGPSDVYLERGPLFLHADACPGPVGDVPEFWRDRVQVLRSYGRDGHISGGATAGPGEHMSTAAALLDNPDVAFVQARNVVYGCYMATLRREAPAPV